MGYIYIASVEKAMDAQSCPDDYSYCKCRAILSNTMQNMTIQGQSYHLLVELYIVKHIQTPRLTHIGYNCCMHVPYYP